MSATIEDAQQAAATEPSVTEPATTTPETDTTTAPPPGEEQTPQAGDTDDKKLDQRDRAIRRLAQEQRDTVRQLRAAQERLERLQPRDPNAPPSPADIDRQIEQRAQQLIEAREHQSRTEAAIAEGNAAFPDFTERCNQVAAMGATDNQAFMATIWKVPGAHKVVAELAENPADTARILSLPPVDLALELSRMSHRIATAPAPPPKPVTQAPPPIRPLETTARAEVDPNRMTSEQYQAWWNKRKRG
jgi:hypothetical protein